MIEVRSVTKRYGSFVAVNDVSFRIGKGEVVGLLGHNGAGKTTIMKMVTGYLEPSEGEILIDGIGIDSDPITVRSKIGYLPENCPVYRDMNVVEYLSYIADMRGVAKADQAVIIKDVILKTQLTDKALSRIATLSKGYQQRVGVAQAILHRPEILILDEPTNGLDPSQIHDMRALLRQLSKNSTVVISTHILQEVEAICDRVMIILNGKLALDSKLESLRHSHRLQVSIGGQKADLSSALKSVREVQRVVDLSSDGSISSFLVELTKNVEGAPVCAKISESIVKAGLPLYSLAPEARNLETVFREINTK